MIDFGIVDAVDAEAIGEPGQRTFRLRARSGANYAALWLEKEQLATLGRAISQVLAERSAHRGDPVGEAAAIGSFVTHPDVDMQVVRLGLDFDADTDRLALLADDQAGLERGDTPTFRMEIRSCNDSKMGRTRPASENAGTMTPLGAWRRFVPGVNRGLAAIRGWARGSAGQNWGGSRDDGDGRACLAERRSGAKAASACPGPDCRRRPGRFQRPPAPASALH
ncbi:MAG TPA: DUF3090 family protein, partial [Dehalococcoidia bacterium]|nr:DUF3090 family protein [Dehalococcoidia bacterium]